MTPLIDASAADCALTPAQMLESMADTLDTYADHHMRPTVLETAQIARMLRVVRQQIDPPTPSPDTVVLPFPLRQAARASGGDAA